MRRMKNAVVWGRPQASVHCDVPCVSVTLTLLLELMIKFDGCIKLLMNVAEQANLWVWMDAINAVSVRCPTSKGIRVY